MGQAGKCTVCLLASVIMQRFPLSRGRGRQVLPSFLSVSSHILVSFPMVFRHKLWRVLNYSFLVVCCSNANAFEVLDLLLLTTVTLFQRSSHI